MSCNDTSFDNLTHNTITVIFTVTMNVCLHAHIAHWMQQWHNPKVHIWT